MATLTPLRYPGGKTIMTPYFEEFIRQNKIQDPIYAEPFAGGAGAAINLLISGAVNKIIINDANTAVFSFWNSLINYSSEFMDLFENTPVTLTEWYKQKEIFEQVNHPSVALGFATFFLNRCNRSGILKAGPIGGNSLEKQNKSKYKLNARFNKDSLRTRLLNIIENSNSIVVSNLDALEFMETIASYPTEVQKDILVYLDPPYYVHGSELYMNFYQHKDHKNLNDFLSQSHIFNWILSYDNVKEIRDLYSGFDLYTFNLKYSINEPKKGKELLTHKKGVILPEPLEIKRVTIKNIPIIKINS